MCIGRTFVLLDCSDQFARMALPVLMDGMSGARAVQPTATCACIAKTLAGKARLWLPSLCDYGALAQGFTKLHPIGIGHRSASTRLVHTVAQ